MHGANSAGSQATQALAHTKGGLRTIVHAVVNGKSRPVSIVLNPSQTGDPPQAVGLLSNAGRWRLALMDKSYESDEPWLHR